MTMKKLMAGLYEGDRVRVEKTDDGRWLTEVKLRDCGAPLGMTTNFYEGSDDGNWVRIGHFPKMDLAEQASEALYAGTHVFQGPHSNDVGHVPGRIMPFAEASDEIARRSMPADARPAP